MKVLILYQLVHGTAFLIDFSRAGIKIGHLTEFSELFLEIKRQQ